MISEDNPFGSDTYMTFFVKVKAVNDEKDN